MVSAWTQPGLDTTSGSSARNGATVARQIVRKLGYRPDVVGDGRAAVEAVLKNRYGLVLMDCNMPEMDGFDATCEIRWREPAGRRTPVIAMTANAMKGDRERCLAAQMDDYIAKPVSVDEVRRVLGAWLGQADTAVGAP
jgi:CheY-like chemotaxis protein